MARAAGGPADLAAPLTVTITDGGSTVVDGATFTPADMPTAWFQAGDQIVYPSRGAAEDFATIHYRRPAGDYGDPTSTDFTDFWGLHVWTGAATETVWTDPLRPIGDRRVRRRVPHRPRRRRRPARLHPPPRRHEGPRTRPVPRVRHQYGHEVWQLQGADPEQPYVAPSAQGPSG